MVYFTNQLKILHKTLENSQKPIFKKKKQKLDVTSIKTYYKVIVRKRKPHVWIFTGEWILN